MRGVAMPLFLGFGACASVPDPDPSGVVRGTVRAADGAEIVHDARGRGETALVFVHGWWPEEFKAKLREVLRSLGDELSSGP